MAWDYPVGGRFAIAVPGDEEIAPEVERFFGRELARYNHAVFYELQPYIVFFFADKSEAEKCIEHFKGEWFDERDKGRGQHWSKWYRGKTAKRLGNRSPSDFRQH